ncbi:MAG: Ig-like domain-containing protein, partial [Thermoplasmata archaeon]|nr:Ig-like domain-containing protein [Thermoplasmata archaeon]
MGTEGVGLAWDATEDWGLENISLEYRYSTDNSTWTDWTTLWTEDGLAGTQASGQHLFVPSDGDGFYEFRSVARDVMGKNEASSNAEARAGLDTTAPTGAFVPYEGLSPDREVQLNITYLDAISGVVKARFSLVDNWDDIIWSDARTDPAPFTFPPESGNHTLFGQVMDQVGLISESFSITVWIDLDDPLCDIEIAGNVSAVTGDRFVRSSTVNLDLSFWELADNSGIASMRLSNDGVWDTEEWVDLTTFMTWDLAPGEGARTVHFQVMDRVGHVSEAVTDTVVVDTSDPYTHSVKPDDGDTDVEVDTEIIIQFSEEMDAPTTESGFSLTWMDGDEVVAAEGTIEWTQEGRTLTFTPDEPLQEGTIYRIVIGPEATDIAGNGLFPAIDHTFDTPEPTVTDTEPPTGTIEIDWDILLHNSTLITVYLTYEDDTGVDAIRLSNKALWDEGIWQTPAGSVAWLLPEGEGPRTIFYQVRDITGKLSETYSKSFKVDMTGPRLEAADPADGSDDVALNTSIRIVFNEALRPLTMKTDLKIYWVDENDMSHDLVGDLTWKSDWRTFTFEPSSDLEEGTTYYIKLDSDTKDLAGNGLYPAISHSFTTEEEDGDGDDGSLWGVVAALIVIVVILVAVIGYIVVRKGREGA